VATSQETVWGWWEWRAKELLGLLELWAGHVIKSIPIIIKAI